MYIDLHTHSNMSDGSLTPSNLIELATNSNLSVVALTDHDTLDGIPEAKEAVKQANANGNPIVLAPGVEISVYYKGRDIHVLGLLVDEENQILKEALSNANGKRNARNEKMAANFRKDGIPLTLEALQNRAQNNVDNENIAPSDVVITRAHFATYLIEHGYADNTQEAFDKYLNENSPYYVPREYLAPQKGIELIHEAQGLSFIAHPFLYDFTLEEVRNMIKDFRAVGLDGIEALHSTHTKDQEDILKKIAASNDLLISGGSDFHGEVKPSIKLGVGKGNLKIPYSIYEAIKEKKASIF